MNKLISYFGVFKRIILCITIIMFLVLLLVNTNDVIGNILFFGIVLLVAGYYFKFPHYLVLYVLSIIGFSVVTIFVLPSIGINLYFGYIFIDKYKILVYANMYIYLMILIFEILEYPNKIVLKIRQDELFKERKFDLYNIKRLIKDNQSNILGIDAAWGMGKTSLISNLIREEKNNYRFIVIDVLSLNFDNTIDFLIKKINFFLLKDGVRNFSASRLLAILQNKYKHLYNVLLEEDDSYYDIFESFKQNICRLRTPIIVIFDDIDRINQGDHLKKLFYISEKLSTCGSNNLKFLMLYNSEKLILQGFSEEYLQKYIPNKVRLTNMSFYSILNTLIGQNIKTNSYINKNRYLIEAILSRINNQLDILNIKEVNTYFSVHYNIRTIKFFMEELESIDLMMSDSMRSKPVLQEALIIACYTKYFLPEIFNSLNTNLSILDNLKLEVDNNMESPILFRQKFHCGLANYNNIALKSNRLNFLKMIFFSLLNIKDDIDSNIQSWYKYKKLEMALYHYIMFGIDYQINYEQIATKLRKVIKSAFWKQETYNIFKEHIFSKDTLQVFYFKTMEPWTLYLDTYKILIFDWSKEEANLQYIKLIREYFTAKHPSISLNHNAVEFFVSLLDSIGLHQFSAVLNCYLILAFKHFYKQKSFLNERDLLKIKRSFLKVIFDLGYTKDSYNKKNMHILNVNQRLDLCITDAIKVINMEIQFINTNIDTFSNLKYYTYQYKLIRVTLKLLMRLKFNEVLQQHYLKNDVVGLPNYTDKQFNSEIRRKLYAPIDLRRELDHRIAYNKQKERNIYDNR